MASKFKELMQDYGKIKQFPMDGPLMPLTEEQAASTQDNSSTKSTVSEPYQQRGLQQETLNYMGNLMAQAKAKGPVPPKDK
jgi:hypothetical protein